MAIPVVDFNLQWMFVFAVSGVELSNQVEKVRTDSRERESGQGICETLWIGKDLWVLTHWKEGERKKSKIKTNKEDKI